MVAASTREECSELWCNLSPLEVERPALICNTLTGKLWKLQSCQNFTEVNIGSPYIWQRWHKIPKKYSALKKVPTSNCWGGNRKGFAWICSQLLLFVQIEKWMFCCIFFTLGGKNAQRRSVMILLGLPSMEGTEKQSQHSYLKAGLLGQTEHSVFFLPFLCVLLGWCSNIVLLTDIYKIIRWYPRISSIGHLPGSCRSYCNNEVKSEQIPLGSFLRASLMMAQSHFIHREGKSRHFLKANKWFCYSAWSVPCCCEP